MSRFFSSKYASLTPYTPGEQPRDMQYIKLNTNESPFPPSPRAVEKAAQAAGGLNLYSDPTCKVLTEKTAQMLGVDADQVLMTNGSDEMINFAFMAFCDEEHPIVFPNITYGFYEVYAQLYNVPHELIPLREDFTIDVNDYIGIGKNIIIANPNAPSGICLSVAEIERIVASNPDNVVIIDEAYVDFGNESCVPLVNKFENLLVIQTFSKSRSLAGGRLGFGVASRELMADLNTIKYSTNPYNINAMTMAMGIAILEDEQYTRKNCRAIIENREYTTKKLRELGFKVIDSCTNFVLAKNPQIDGRELYLKLRENGILVRHFDKPEIAQYNRITIGSRQQMDAFLETVGRILEGKV